MQNINNHKINENINKQLELCQDMCTLSSHMIDRLAQNNLEYSKKTLNNLLKLMQPVSNQVQHDFLTPLKAVLTESIENNSKLCHDNQEVIKDTMDQIKTSVQNKQQDFSFFKINVFDMWKNLSPAIPEPFKAFYAAPSSTLNSMNKRSDYESKDTNKA